ncbi:MAG: hypothetical protein KKF12_08715 [Proteobacteria bacterium]|nr:hypothetical protein [Desulfobacula sp.]MBU4130888.1 hypothetical protein [Pseudomonadota bacterium]
MSDPNLEEESLISQDDIDKLLDSSSIEEAEGELESRKNNTPDLEDLGELSQDDIDSLMGGADDAADEDIMGELSQDDIDSLMGGNDDTADADEMGELSQDDIDSLMGGADEVADEDAADEDEIGELSQEDIDSLMGGTDDAADEDEMGEISQDAIDSLMSRDTGEEDIDSSDLAGEEEIDELISMDDIQSLIGETEGEIPDSDGKTEDSLAISEVPDGAAVVSDDFVIDAAEALDVSQCLITQATLDELIRNAPGPGDVPDTIILDSDPEPDIPVSAGDADSEEPSLEPVVLDMDVQSDPGSMDVPGLDDLDMDVSDDEFEGLLDADDIQLDLGSPAGDDVTQEDIDALLQESDEEEDLMGDEEDILISQDDIDTLLMAADQEDEDVLGDMMGDDMDAGMDDDYEDEDILDMEGEADTGSRGDQVVLEGGDDAKPDEGGSKPSEKRWKNLFKSKLVIAAASAILVLGISVPSVYFLFFSHDPAQIPEKMPVPMTMEAPGRDIEVASVNIDTQAMPEVKKSGNIILTDFVVLASDQSKDMAYVTVDISIDYSDQRAYHEINNNLSFYRDLIYESIQKNLVWEKRNEVTEADLIWGVETTLKKVLPSNYIERISFKSFRAS